MAVAAVAAGLRAVAVTEATERVAAAWVEAEGGKAAATRVATVPAAAGSAEGATVAECPAEEEEERSVAVVREKARAEGRVAVEAEAMGLVRSEKEEEAAARAGAARAAAVQGSWVLARSKSATLTDNHGSFIRRHWGLRRRGATTKCT